MSRTPIIGVMGGGTVSAEDEHAAQRLGELIAMQGWILLNGGRNAGVMEASARGAKRMGGLTVGILPGRSTESVSSHIDIPIFTGMGDARNCINVLSSDIVVACPGGAGTLSEIALALKAGKRVVLLRFRIGEPFTRYMEKGQLTSTETPEEAVEIIRGWLTESFPSGLLPRRGPRAK